MLKVELFIAGNKMVNLSSFPSTDMIWVIHFRESMFEKVVTVHVHKTIYIVIQNGTFSTILHEIGSF